MSSNYEILHYVSGRFLKFHNTWHIKPGKNYIRGLTTGSTSNSGILIGGWGGDIPHDLHHDRWKGFRFPPPGDVANPDSLLVD